jgi:dipeptidyl aminopeptidase/acylaminoacyl peptidase
VLTASLDRAVSAPLFSPDGRSVLWIETDDRREYPIRVSLSGGSVERMLDSDVAVLAQNEAAGHYAVLATQDDTPPALFALENGALRKLAGPNALWLRDVTLGRTRGVSFLSKDGTEVHGLLTLPPDYRDGSKVPLLLRIHGGPDGEDSHAFQFERQLFAANGYAVLNVNYRGSSGRGAAYQKAIFADWGHLEVEDLLAGVDAVVAQGIADAARLGIGGAGSANQISMYGLDEYVIQYDRELGPPWRSQDQWVKLSYPFFHADHIHTPTLFLGGDKDFNVPLAGGEQMYEALRSLGVPTELIIYPGAFHGITRPSYVKDRFEQYLAWYGKYVKGKAATSSVQRASSSAPSRSSQ